MCDEEDEQEEEEDAAQECRTLLFVDGFSCFRVKAVRIRYDREYTLKTLLNIDIFYNIRLNLYWIEFLSKKLK